MTKTIYGGAEEGAAMNHRQREVMDAIQCLITYNKRDEASNARRAENHVGFWKAYVHVGPAVWGEGREVRWMVQGNRDAVRNYMLLERCKTGAAKG
jgi:hypothetical protein